MATLKLESSDKIIFEVEKDSALQSDTIKNMFEDITSASDESLPTIPLPNIDGKMLKKIIEYWNWHKTNPTLISEEQKEKEKDEKRTDDIIPWDLEFCKVDNATLFELILAANCLDVKPLLDLACKTVANMIKGKTPDEIRKTFNIKNDFTAAEEEQVKKENEWCEVDKN